MSAFSLAPVKMRRFHDSYRVRSFQHCIPYGLVNKHALLLLSACGGTVYNQTLAIIGFGMAELTSSCKVYEYKFLFFMHRNVDTMGSWSFRIGTHVRRRGTPTVVLHTDLLIKSITDHSSYNVNSKSVTNRCPH